MAQEFVRDPRTGRYVLKGTAGDSAGNHASLSASRVRQALIAARKAISGS